MWGYALHIALACQGKEGIPQARLSFPWLAILWSAVYVPPTQDTHTQSQTGMQTVWISQTDTLALTRNLNNKPKHAINEQARKRKGRF